MVIATGALGMDYCLRKTFTSLNSLFSICRQISQITPVFAHKQSLAFILAELNLDFKFNFLHRLLTDFQDANRHKNNNNDNNNNDNNNNDNNKMLIKEVQGDKDERRLEQKHLIFIIPNAKEPSVIKTMEVHDVSSSFIQKNTPTETMRFVLSTAQTKLEQMHIELERLNKLHASESWLGKQFWPIQWQDQSLLLRSYTSQLNELIQMILRLGSVRVFPL